METNGVCPLCGDTNCKQEDTAEWGRKIVCNHFRVTCIIHEDVDYLKYEEDPANVQKRYNCIVSHLIRFPHYGRSGYWKFFYEEHTVGNPIDEPQKINIANDMKSYPSHFNERLDKALMNLSILYPNVGRYFSADSHELTALYGIGADGGDRLIETQAILNFLSEIGYLNTKSMQYAISAKGWQHISDLSSREKEINQGFIAMAFNEETKVIGDCFHEAIDKCGYIPRRIDTKEHNNQIVPEIFFEIARSKFLVVDVTVPNYGAYYEAGYGEALNKQVIVCCRKHEFLNASTKPHFDIAQKNTIVWEDEEDLIKRLMNRIEATVGKIV